MANLQQGWDAYRRGNFEQAFSLFGSGDDVASVAGRALALLAQGRGAEATSLVENQAQRQSSPEMLVLLADIKGRQGARSDAERILTRAVSSNRDNGFYRSLLGEQRIRLGKWEEGTDDFIAAMGVRGERTFPHVQQVVADMVDAVAARRIPSKDAMRFVNRIDYSAAKKTQEISSFFATARRSINGNRRMERGNLVEPWAVGVPVRSPSTNAPPQNTQPSPPSRQAHSTPNRPASPPAPQAVSRSQQQRPTPPAQSRANSRQDRSTSRSRQADRAATTARNAPNRQDAMRERLAQRHADSRQAPELLIEANQKNMTAIMQQERHQNEELQSLVQATPPQVWPSQVEVAIDTIQPIGFSNKSILRGSSSINTNLFRLTSGDIGVEITLERCMHNLMAAAHSVKPVNLPLVPETIARLELNLQDDFLDSMPSLDALYAEETQVDDQRQLAIGKLIGECIVQSYGGVWEHADPPQESVIHLGDRVLDPMGLAGEFLQMKNFDDVCLRDLVDEADEAILTSTSLPTFTDHIDPTPGLEKEALRMSLAEMWVSYRFDLADTDIQTIAPTVSIIGRPMKTFIAFGIHSTHVPHGIIRSSPGSVDSDGQTRMAYCRKTGEFLVLGSRKHFRRLLQVSGTPLVASTASRFAEWAQALFRPGWTLMTNKEAADKWSREFDTDKLQPPRFRSQGNNSDLRLSAVDRNNRLQRIDIRYRPEKTQAFEIVVGGS